MSKPLPGPNVMLPALDLSGPPNLDHIVVYKRREAVWKRLVSASHKEWCLCGHYINHFISKSRPLEAFESCGEGEGESCGAENAGGDPSGDISDADMLAGGGFAEE
nr:ORF2 [Torque teno felis virus]